MRGEELVAFLHSDISGLNRGRSVPAAELDERFAAGVGWVPADQALTPFGPIAEPNPFGSLGDLRLLPDRDTRVRVDLWDDVSPLHFYFCDAVNTDGSPWDACPRTLLKGALSRLEEAGFRLVASFEQEFILEGLGSEPGPGFSLEAQRLVEPFGPLVMAGLRQAGLEPEVFLPEYGEGQYEVPCAPAEGISGADRAAAMREVVREVARRLGYRASFVPKADPEGVGNGVHIHLSLLDLEDRPVFYDPERPGRGAHPNLEFRAADAAACPHLALAVLVLAGLRGLQDELPEPTLIEDDPTGLDEEERRRLGIIELPGSLEEALGALESDEVVRSWLSKDLLDCYSSVKRNEIDLLEGAEPREACERYLRVY